MDDKAGDPVYVSSCGCVATVKPHHMGFGVLTEGKECAMQDLGEIIRIMYPSDVSDFIVSNAQSVIIDDKLIQGVAAGYNVAMDFDPVEYQLLIVIDNLR